MYEVWKRKQMHEDARKMHRTKIIVKKFGKMGKGGIWEDMISLEDWTGRERS